MEHCSFEFYSSSFFQTCFIVFVTISSVPKHPTKSFFNPIKYILTSFTHSVLLLSILLFSFNVNFFNFFRSTYSSSTKKYVAKLDEWIRSLVPQLSNVVVLGQQSCHQTDDWNSIHCRTNRTRKRLGCNNHYIRNVYYKQVNNIKNKINTFGEFFK